MTDTMQPSSRRRQNQNAAAASSSSSSAAAAAVHTRRGYSIPPPVTSLPSRDRGRDTGLKNLGNSCYLAAVLQALLGQRCFVRDLLETARILGCDTKKMKRKVKEREMRKRMMGKDFVEEEEDVYMNAPTTSSAAAASSSSSNLVTATNTISSSFYHTLVTLVLQMQSASHGILDPGRLKAMISSRYSKFSGEFQQDAHEFLAECLAHLDEDIMEIMYPQTKLKGVGHSVMNTPIPTPAQTPRTITVPNSGASAITTANEGERKESDMMDLSTNEGTHSNAAAVAATSIPSLAPSQSPSPVNLFSLSSASLQLQVDTISPIYKNLHCEIEQTLECTKCAYRRTKSEHFNDISLDLPDAVSSKQARSASPAIVPAASPTLPLQPTVAELPVLTSLSPLPETISMTPMTPSTPTAAVAAAAVAAASPTPSLADVPSVTITAIPSIALVVTPVASTSVSPAPSPISSSSPPTAALTPRAGTPIQQASSSPPSVESIGESTTTTPAAPATPKEPERVVTRHARKALAGGKAESTEPKDAWNNRQTLAKAIEHTAAVPVPNCAKHNIPMIPALVQGVFHAHFRCPYHRCSHERVIPLPTPPPPPPSPPTPPPVPVVVAAEVVTPTPAAAAVKAEGPPKKVLGGNYLASLSQLLSQFFQPHTIDYRCDHCDSSHLRKSYSFKQLPRVLILHVKRFQPNLLRGTYQKRTDRLKIDEMIDLSTACTSNTRKPLPMGEEEMIDEEEEEDDEEEQANEAEEERKGSDMRMDESEGEHKSSHTTTSTSSSHHHTKRNHNSTSASSSSSAHHSTPAPFAALFASSATAACKCGANGMCAHADGVLTDSKEITQMIAAQYQQPQHSGAQGNTESLTLTGSKRKNQEMNGHIAADGSIDTAAMQDHTIVSDASTIVSPTFTASSPLTVINETTPATSESEEAPHKKMKVEHHHNNSTAVTDPSSYFLSGYVDPSVTLSGSISRMQGELRQLQQQMSELSHAPLVNPAVAATLGPSALPARANKRDSALSAMVMRASALESLIQDRVDQHTKIVNKNQKRAQSKATTTALSHSASSPSVMRHTPTTAAAASASSAPAAAFLPGVVPSYELSAIIHHKGPIATSGHYITDLKSMDHADANSGNGSGSGDMNAHGGTNGGDSSSSSTSTTVATWKRYDDAYVRSLDATQAISYGEREGYLFFYQYQPVLNAEHMMQEKKVKEERKKKGITASSSASFSPYAASASSSSPRIRPASALSSSDAHSGSSGVAAIVRTKPQHQSRSAAMNGHANANEVSETIYSPAYVPAPASATTSAASSAALGLAKPFGPDAGRFKRWKIVNGVRIVWWVDKEDRVVYGEPPS